MICFSNFICRIEAKHLFQLFPAALLKCKLILGTIFILRKGIEVGGWSRKWQFSLNLCSEIILW